MRVGNAGLDLGAERELLVREGVADAAGQLVDVFELLAELTLEDRVRAPVPARTDLVAEEQLELEPVRRLIIVGELDVQGRVPEQLAPVRERVAHLELLLVEIARAFAALLVVDDVHVDLEAVGQPDLEA